MSAEELISLLKKHGITDVLLCRDAEGNGFSALSDASEAFVLKEYDGGYTEELWFADGWDDDEELDTSGLRKVLVLWPV